MLSRAIKLHKGVDNVVKFKVFDMDKKLVDIQDLEVQAAFIDTVTRERVLRKECTITNSKGILELTIYEDDLTNMAPSFYTLAITGKEYDVPQQDGIVASTPFYTDTAANINLTVEVVDNIDKTPIPTVEILSKDWLRGDGHMSQDPIFTCGPFPAARLKNYQNGTHTIAIYADDYTGTFEAFGTLELTPPADISYYFPLNLTDLKTELTYDHFTGIDAYTFQANILWIMFRYQPDPTLFLSGEQGEITKLQLRT
jgi:hypothetical protein